MPRGVLEEPRFQVLQQSDTKQHYVGGTLRYHLNKGVLFQSCPIVIGIRNYMNIHVRTWIEVSGNRLAIKSATVFKYNE